MKKFQLGTVYITQGIKSLIENKPILEVSINIFLEIYQRGNWGVMSDSDKKINDAALQNNDRIFAAYMLDDNTKIWIITEHDRSFTTILLPHEY